MEQALSGKQVKIQLPDGRNVTLKLKDGLYHGQLIRLKEAHAGEPEALVLQVNVLEHPFYTMAGLDIHADILISPAEAHSGVIRTMPGPDGRPLRIRIPAGVREGDEIRVTGVGFRKGAQQGDVIFIVHIDENMALMQWPGLFDARPSDNYKN